MPSNEGQPQSFSDISIVQPPSECPMEKFCRIYLRCPSDKREDVFWEMMDASENDDMIDRLYMLFDLTPGVDLDKLSPEGSKELDMRIEAGLKSDELRPKIVEYLRGANWVLYEYTTGLESHKLEVALCDKRNGRDCGMHHIFTESRSFGLTPTRQAPPTS